MRRFLAAAALVAAGFTASAVPAEAQTSYRVMCQPGSGMSAVLFPGGTIQLTFGRGDHGAAAGPPAPGTCIWLDRAYGAGEPNRMWVNANVAMASYLSNAILSGGVFYADIFNDRAGWMVVTRVGL